MKKRIVNRRTILFDFLCVSLLIILSVSGLWILARLENANGTSPTPSANITPVPSSAHATATSLARPLFFDDFNDNAHGWTIGTVPGYTRTVQNHALTLTTTNHTTLIESIPTNMTFHNFSLTTTFALLQADKQDSVGLYLRGDSNLDHDYRIDLYGNNTYAISEESLDLHNNAISTFLVPPTSSPFLNSVGKHNVFAVTMSNIKLTLQINGHTVSSITNSDYINGQIALFVSNTLESPATTAAFSHLVIYPLSETAFSQHCPLGSHRTSNLS